MFKITTKALMLMLCVLSSQIVLSQACDAELKVEKNRSYKSVSMNGAFYKMVLTNTSSSAETYTIQTNDLNTSCASKHALTSKANVKLDVSLLKSDSRSFQANEILVRPGQSYAFTIKVTPKTDTPVDSWSCIEVNAVSTRCKSSVSSVVLRSYVPNPANDE